jgi:hypothetical protein
VVAGEDGVSVLTEAMNSSRLPVATPMRLHDPSEQVDPAPRLISRIGRKI